MFSFYTQVSRCFWGNMPCGDGTQGSWQTCCGLRGRLCSKWWILVSGQSSNPIRPSLPTTKHNPPLSLAACKDTPEMVAKSQQHKHDHLLHERPACVARLAVHAWLRLCHPLCQFSHLLLHTPVLLTSCCDVWCQLLTFSNLIFCWKTLEQ